MRGISTTQLQTHPHRRYNPLSGDWVLVSPHRTARPWQGARGQVASTPTVSYDSACYLCPGNKRANGEQNPQYRKPFSFTNDYAALYRHNQADQAFETADEDRLFVAKSEEGVCRVLCYAPQHNLHFTDFSDQQIVEIIDLWEREYRELAADPKIAHVQIFENRGQQMGASNPHPHGQIWAQYSIPYIAARKLERQQEYHARTNGGVLLFDYLQREQQYNERVLYTNDHFAWVVPFWACWPFETLILPLARCAHGLEELNDVERRALAGMLKTVIGSYDWLFNSPCSYSMGIHLPPTSDIRNGKDASQTAGAKDGWQFHIGFYPPVLRSATVRKFMVGYELCAMPQRDITPEQAAKQLIVARQRYQSEGPVTKAEAKQE